MLELNVFNGSSLINYFSKVSEEKKLKLPVLNELHILIFSFLPPENQQKLITVNKFWNKTILWVAKHKQTLKIKEFVLGFEWLFPEKIEEFTTHCEFLLKDSPDITLKNYRDSIQIQEMKKIVLDALRPSNLDFIKLFPYPFIIEDVVEICTLYKEYQDNKLNNNDWWSISGKLAEKGDFEGAIKIAKEIDFSDACKSNTISFIIDLLAQKGNISLGEELANEINYQHYELLGEVAFLKGDHMAVKRFAEKIQKRQLKLIFIDTIFAAGDKAKSLNILAKELFSLSYDQMQKNAEKEKIIEHDMQLTREYRKFLKINDFDNAILTIQSMIDCEEKDYALCQASKDFVQKGEILLAEQTAEKISSLKMIYNPYEAFVTRAFQKKDYESVVKYSKKMHPDYKSFDGIVKSLAESGEYDKAEEVARDKLSGREYYTAMSYVQEQCKKANTTNEPEKCSIQ